jgi:hypothetical protein
MSLPSADARVIDALAEVLFLCDGSASFERQSPGSAMDLVASALRAALVALPCIDEAAAWRMYEGVLNGGVPSRLYARVLLGDF